MIRASSRDVHLLVLDIQAWVDPIEALLHGEIVDGIRLAADSVERCGRFVHREDALRGAGGELLRKIALERHGGTTLSSAEVRRDASGKPWIPEFPNVHFNISHSGSLVVCTVDTSPIGVDVEQHRTVDLALPAQCLTTTELQRLCREGSEPFEFYTLWTIKESLLKRVGVGLSIDPRLIEVTPIDDTETLWVPRFGPEAPSGYRLPFPSDIADSVRSDLCRTVTRVAAVGKGYSCAVSTWGNADLCIGHLKRPGIRGGRLKGEHVQSR